MKEGGRDTSARLFFLQPVQRINFGLFGPLPRGPHLEPAYPAIDMAHLKTHWGQA